jgi:hypothetical protein
MKDIGLLLAYADTQDAMLADGLPWQAAAEGDAPLKKPEALSAHLRSDGADPNDLVKQRWGLIVPKGAKGKRLREIIKDLVDHRKGEQAGYEPMVYELPPNMTAEQSWGWWRDVYHAPETDQLDKPLYGLILGGPELISWDFQTTVGRDLYLGRLAFPDDAGYESYVAKVLAFEAAAPGQARALFHTVRDGTDATKAAYRDLMGPALERVKKNAERNRFGTKNIVTLGDMEGVSMHDFLDAAADPNPTMAFTVSHGIGAGRGGWASPEHMHREQGAMSFGKGIKLTHELVEKGAFLPGGAWFFFACLGAGTPVHSSYHHWLKKLQGMGAFSGNVGDVLASLPAAGQAPFMARMPQAALANPHGPLSIVGHVDLAWTYGFQDQEVVVDAKGQEMIQTKERSARFDNIFQELVDGARTGAAYTALNTTFNNTNGELTTMFDAEEQARSEGKAITDTIARQLKKASKWMLRQDVAAYVTLGDPAARLNIAKAQPVARVPRAYTPAAVLGVPAAAASPSAGKVKKIDLAKMEKAVLQVIGGDELAPGKVAQKLVDKGHEVSTADVEAWVETYQAAGRAALEKL